MQTHSEDQYTLEDYWRIIWRRKWVVGLTVVAITSLVVAASFIMIPLYEASATLRIREPKPSLLGGDLWGTGVSALTSEEEINTQIEIVKSRSVLEEVIRQLDLTEEFGIAKDMGAEERLQAALSRLRKGLSVSNISHTELVKVSVRSNNPELARDTANSLSRIFIDRNLESKRAEANAVLTFVSGQVDQVSAKLKSAEEELLRYKQSEGISDFDEEARLRVERLAEIQGLHQEARLARQVLDTRIKSLLEQMVVAGSSDGAPASVSSTPAIRRMQGQVSALQVELARLESGSPSGHRSAAAIRARIDSLRKEIQAEIEKVLGSGKTTAVNSALQMQLAEYQSQDIVLSARESALLDLITVYEEEINKLSAREVSLSRLERARRTNEELYDALMRAKNDAGIQAASQIGNIDVVDPAVTPLRPVRPKRKENAIVALAMSLFLGIILSFLIEYSDKTLKSEEEMKRLLGVPILGTIPRFGISGLRNGSKNGNRRRDGLALETRDDPTSVVSQAFRLLRANLRFLEVDSELKTIMVTSPTPGDGKTTVAANLATVLAAHENRVLVIDADFKIPAVHRIFRLPQSPGIANVLSEGVRYQSVVQQVQGVENLDVMTVGPIPPHSSALLVSLKMKRLIEELRDDYARIIFDVPPVLAATDALDLAPSLDGVLLVSKVGKTDQRAIRKTRDVFGYAQVRIFGGILNGTNARDGRYGYSYYYYDDTARTETGVRPGRMKR